MTEPPKFSELLRHRRETLLWRQGELSIARYLAGDPRASRGPVFSREFLESEVRRCEREVCRALDRLWELQKVTEDPRASRGPQACNSPVTGGVTK